MLVAVFGEALRRFPVSNELRKLARTLLAAERPADDSPREIYRFRRRSEPWALSALAFLGATDLYDAVRAARADHPEPLLRGEDVLALGIEPGPEVGRLLERVAEERAVGTIATRDEALDLVRAELGARPDLRGNASVLPGVEAADEAPVHRSGRRRRDCERGWLRRLGLRGHGS